MRRLKALQQRTLWSPLDQEYSLLWSPGDMPCSNGCLSRRNSLALGHATGLCFRHLQEPPRISVAPPIGHMRNALYRARKQTMPASPESVEYRPPLKQPFRLVRWAAVIREVYLCHAVAHWDERDSYCTLGFDGIILVSCSSLWDHEPEPT